MDPPKQQQQPPPSPKGTTSPGCVSPSKPGHLQPLDGQPYRTSTNSMPPTPGKSALGPTSGAVTARAVESILSGPSSYQVAQQQQQQQSDDDNIKVVVRVRPLFPAEEAKGATHVVQVSEDCSSLKVVVPGPAGATMQKDFAFHACLGPETSQADVVALCGINQLLDAALAGYHVTIFAYGQTGSGKTHTMSGKEDIISDDCYMGHEHDGIISRAVQYLFHQAITRKDAKYSLKASYLEIYNEGVYDLVNFNPKAKSLPVKWDASYGFYVQGLKVVPCGQQRTMMEVIRTGMKHRKVGSHRLNMESSRSHAIMTIYCDATPTDPTSYDFGTIRYGKLSFVDLAGSERVKDSMSEGVMLKETININKSLTALGKVISTLAEHDAAGTTAHVPYRDSKLTKLLMDSLGGSALTLMIACCSPSSLQVEETLSTLGYATRARNIRNRPTVQYDPREAQISMLRREIELLRQENNLLKEQMRGGGFVPGHHSLPTTPSGTHILQGVVRPTALGIPSQLGSPASSIASSPVAGLTAAPLAGSPSGPTEGGIVRSNSLGGPGQTPLSPMEQPLRSSLNELDLRANAARNAASVGNSINGSPVGSNELLRRLRETQALLVKFSEENSRLARDNEKLQAGRNVLSAEHATVLDEIDMLRGKLTQLEHNVLAAAVASGSGAAGAPAGTQQSANAAAGAAASSAAAVSAMIDIKALLSSLGLGGEAVADLPAVGDGPLGTLGQHEAGTEWSGSTAVDSRLLGPGRHSARSDYSLSSSTAPAAATSGAHSLSPGRSVIASPSNARPSAVSRSNLSSANTHGLASTAKSIINRTPMRPSTDAAMDDSIIVSNNAGLAVLLSPAAAAGSSSVAAPGQLSSQTNAASLAATGRVPSFGLAGAVPASPKMVSFAERPGMDIYNQLPSSATSTSSAINRPLPYKPTDRAALSAAPGRKDLQAQQNPARLSASKPPPPQYQYNIAALH